MLTEILLAAGEDPTISVGGMLDSIGGNIRIGGPELFVTEACEYTNSFLSFFPTIEIILNVEADHLDFLDVYKRQVLGMEKADMGQILFRGRDLTRTPMDCLLYTSQVSHTRPTPLL